MRGYGACLAGNCGLPLQFFHTGFYYCGLFMYSFILQAGIFSKSLFVYFFVKANLVGVA